jgi:hypothetical protein
VYGAEQAALQRMIDVELAVWGVILPTAAFLITRPQPLRDEGSLARWHELNTIYGRLALEQGERYPVKVIHNDRSVNEALQQVIQTANAYHT